LPKAVRHLFYKVHGHGFKPKHGKSEKGTGQNLEATMDA